ncbi:MAG: ATP-grasp domain-containing protein [Lachnospiraceae bacterium]|nr:ATP-grasp domain-containing protein [Lachnospiraceae bacterium]
MNKIENQILENENKCYIGIRESDTYYCKNFFDNMACIFSNMPSQEVFSIRHNQNIDHREIFLFFAKKIQQFYNKNATFYFYNQRTAYNYDECIQQRCRCINAKDLLDFINNKLSVKEWFAQNSIPVVPFATFFGKDLLYSKLCAHFQGYTTFVIQAAHGGGGIGTFYAEAQHFSEILDKVEPMQRYIVSPYITSVSVNIHIFISEKQTVLSPASVQIIELKQQQLCYRGGDFCVFQEMQDSVKKKIRKFSTKLADMLRKKGYRGIAGIDFIVTSDEQVYCCEINPRFQASTFILDRYLHECNNNTLLASSCFELNEMAFQGNMTTTLSFEDEINYSCYFYYNDGIPSSYFKEKFELLKGIGLVDVFDDGMEFYLDNHKTDNNSYLFRAVFPHSISKISPDMTLWLNDNITINQRPCDDISYKTALLNQGVRVEGERINIKNGVYESIDITVRFSQYIQPHLNINCAFGINLSQYSPFLVKLSKNTEELYYYNEKIADICVEKNRLYSLHELEQKMLFISTDRLRIKLVSGCENKNLGKGCAFCNVPYSEYRFSMKQILQALQSLKNLDIHFRHILIGGGSCLAPDSWDKIIEICNYLKSDNVFREKPISIMTMLPPKSMLIKLKNAGVEEVAFNLEIADEKLARQLMPAKRSLGKDAYYEILQDAVRIFGIGNVRSALLVGLDKEQDIYNEIVTLAEIGVIPCLSAFRALPKTPYENDLGPDNAYLLKVYNYTSDMLSSMSGNVKELGPPCKACRNNMLIL